MLLNFILYLDNLEKALALDNHKTILNIRIVDFFMYTIKLH